MASVLIMLPVLLLLLSGIGIIVLQQVKPSIGYAWLIGAAGGFLTVGVAVFLHWRLPIQLTVEQLRLFTDLSAPLAFRLDEQSWPYMVSLALLALAFILTDAARLDTEARPFNWAVGLGLAGMGVMSVMAANPTTLIVTWTALDLVELLMVLTTPAGRRMGVQTVTAFSVRVFGTLLVILAILFARSKTIDFVLTPIPGDLGIFMLLAAGLRLGVLPLNLPYTQEVYTWRGLGNVMRMVTPASSLMVLGRLPDQFLPPQWKGPLLALTVLAGLYGSVLWLSSDNELNGRTYWSLSFAALAIASVISGDPQASKAWGVALILSGSVLFFYSARRRQILFVPLLGLLGIVGLPFTPASSGWLGVSHGGFKLHTFLLGLSVIFLAWGYVRHVLRGRSELYRMERWVHTVYPIGLMFLIVGQFAIGVLGWPGSFTVGLWWFSAALTFVGSLGVVVFFSFRGALLNNTLTKQWIVVYAGRVGAWLSDIFSLNWLYRFLGWIYRIIQNMIQLLTAMFEGDGGILWSMVMLALLISLIGAGIR